MLNHFRCLHNNLHVRLRICDDGQTQAEAPRGREPAPGAGPLAGSM